MHHDPRLARALANELPERLHGPNELVRRRPAEPDVQDLAEIRRFDGRRDRRCLGDDLTAHLIGKGRRVIVIVHGIRAAIVRWFVGRDRLRRCDGRQRRDRLDRIGPKRRHVADRRPRGRRGGRDGRGGPLRRAA